jgi:hypothetical protein
MIGLPVSGHVRVAFTRWSNPSSSLCDVRCSFLGFEQNSHVQCPIFPQRVHSSPVGLFNDPSDEELSRLGLWPRLPPLPMPPPLAPPLKWFCLSCLFLRASHSSVRYNFPSYCNDVVASSNASSASFSRPIKSATDIVGTSSNVLIMIVIFLKRGGRDQSIFMMISLSFTSSPSVARCAAMPLRHNA